MVDLEERRARQRAYYAANADKERARRRVHRAVNRDRINAQKLALLAANPERRAKNVAENRKRRHADLEAYRARNRKNDGLPEPLYPEPAMCEICAWPRMEGKPLHLDHDHVTGQFRGWLCNKCNVGIGMLGDDLASLRRAVAYLEKHA
jgi:Recombination endonuclease VII